MPTFQEHTRLLRETRGKVTEKHSLIARKNKYYTHKECKPRDTPACASKQR